MTLLVCMSCSSAPLQEHNGEDTSPTDTEKDSSDVWDLTYIMGVFEPSQDSNFVMVATEHADRTGLFLRKETYEAFKKMYEAALEDSIQLVIRSATRNFEYQKGIWEAKWTGRRAIESGRKASDITDAKDRALEILKYSSMPGTSRHHWGTDIDLNAFTNEYFESGTGLRIYQWLLAHASSYGFCQPYTKKGPLRPNGYEEEKWHWSYRPISDQITKAAKNILKNEMIKGFLGAAEAQMINVKDNYILGIDSACIIGTASD